MHNRIIVAASAIALLSAPIQGQSPATQSASPSAENDIIVIARKLRKVRISYLPFGRHLKHCNVTISSGDPRMDRIACAIVRACVADGYTEPASARRCFYNRVDSLGDMPASIAYQDSEPDLQTTVPLPAPTRDPDEIIVEGRRPEVKSGRWHLTLTSFLFHPSTILTRGGSDIFPPERWKICLPEDAAEQNMIRLLGASPERKSLVSGCSSMKLTMEGERISGSYACGRSDGNYDARVSGRFQPDRLDIMVTTKIAQNDAGKVVIAPGMTDTSEKISEIRSHLIAKRIGDCRQ
jgi:hypothetical protein